MAEEKKPGVSAGVKTLTKMLVGIILIVVGIALCIRWFPALAILIKGCLGPFLILLGLVFLAIAKE